MRLPGSTLLAAQPSSVEGRVQELEDHVAIERLLMQYGVALDSRDFATYSQLFAREGTWSGSTGTFKGPAAIKDGMEKAFNTPGAPPPGGTFHLLTNPIIQVHGDRATALSKWTFCRTSRRFEFHKRRRLFVSGVQSIGRHKSPFLIPKTR